MPATIGGQIKRLTINGVEFPATADDAEIVLKHSMPEHKNSSETNDYFTTKNVPGRLSCTIVLDPLINTKILNSHENVSIFAEMANGRSYGGIVRATHEAVENHGSGEFGIEYQGGMQEI